ncbi:MAG: PepSY-associated TM helix domain-containing protein, partial [Gallionella sp.]
LIRRTERDKLVGGPLWPITRHNLMDVIYMLHVKLALGTFGHWTLGIVAVLWTLDCFVGFYLTLPVRKLSNTVIKPKFSPRKNRLVRWLPAWLVTWRGQAYRINFKLHTAAGLWTWVMLLVFAWSSVYFLLGTQVYQPVMKMFGMRPMLEEFYAMPSLPQPRLSPALSWREAAATGERLAAERAPIEGFIPGRALNLQYEEDSGLFIYTMASSRGLADDSLGTIICFDGDSGALWKVFHLTGQDAGTTFTAWIALLHTAKIWGMPFRIFVCVMGLVVVMLSITGVYIWFKKWKARRSSKEKHARLVEQEASA